MTTNAQIIDDALREINVLNEVQNASSEQGEQSLRKLNQMMELWKEDSLDVGWFEQADTTDTAPIPDYATTAVTLALAIRCASQYGATVSQELIATADYAISRLRRKLIKEKLDNTDMSHLPEGSGHWGNRYDITTDT
jgi:hypothetical protein